MAFAFEAVDPKVSFETRLHRGTASSSTLVDIAVWESNSALLRAFMSAEFQEKAGAYPDGLPARPFLAEKLAVEGSCVA